ncbi:hypothetical protein PM082_017034 [Marasmius tenuissimus]|nr:hypothetical protein PM082_017034 [Marasmius tenuissimus]
MTAGNIEWGKTSAQGVRALTDLPLFLGYVCSAFLHGVFMIQVFVYLFAFGDDRRYGKVFVWLVLVSNWAFTIVALVPVLQILVEEGKICLLANTMIFNKVLPILCGLVPFLVQLFYGCHIYHLGGHVSLPIVISLLSAGQWVMLIIGWSGPEGVNRDMTFLPIWLSLAIAVDSLIVVTLLVLLTKAARKLRTARAKTALARTTIICIEAGAITVIAALLELLFFCVAFRNSLIFVILFYMLPSLYSNCMMATLNARLLMPWCVFRESTGPSTGDWRDAYHIQRPGLEVEILKEDPVTVIGHSTPATSQGSVL